MQKYSSGSRLKVTYSCQSEFRSLILIRATIRYESIILPWKPLNETKIKYLVDENEWLHQALSE